MSDCICAVPHEWVVIVLLHCLRKQCSSGNSLCKIVYLTQYLINCIFLVKTFPLSYSVLLDLIVRLSGRVHQTGSLLFPPACCNTFSVYVLFPPGPGRIQSILSAFTFQNRPEYRRAKSLTVNTAPSAMIILRSITLRNSQHFLSRHVFQGSQISRCNLFYLFFPTPGPNISAWTIRSSIRSRRGGS